MLFEFLIWMFELEYRLGYKPGKAGFDLWQKNYTVIEAAREMRKVRFV